MTTRPELNETTFRELLAERPAMTTSELAGHFGVTKQWISQFAAKLRIKLAGTARDYVEGL